jgi:hypothetical protein
MSIGLHYAAARCVIFFITSSRASSVGITTGYGLNDRDSRVRFPAEAGNFSFHHLVQNGAGAHPASYPVGTRGSFPSGRGVKLTTHPHVVPRSRMRGAIPSPPNTPSWCGVQLKHRDSFTFTFTLDPEADIRCFTLMLDTISISYFLRV